MSYQIKDGKITMKTPDGDVQIDLDYIKSDMKKAVRPIKRNSFYVKKIREYITELDQGFDSIEPVQTKLRSFFGASEKGLSDCCRRWVELLQMVRNFSRIKTGGDTGVQGTNPEQSQEIKNEPDNT